MEGLSFLGVALDDPLNGAVGSGDVSAAAVPTLVAAAREDVIVAEQVAAVLGGA